MKTAPSTGQNVGIVRLNKCAAGALLAMMLLLFGCGGGSSDDPLANHYTTGQPTQSGSLGDGDANSGIREGARADYYLITGDGEVTIDLTASFDTFLSVYDENGVDLTREFIAGARAVLVEVKKHNIKKAILKAKSPSCGIGKIYDGSFTGKLVDGDGVTAAFLKKEGMECLAI